MTQVTKADISRMENEDDRYSRGEHNNRNKHKHKQLHVENQSKGRNHHVNLQSLRGASPKMLRAQFAESFDDD